MYCPSCRSEFREGFFRCEDCDKTLVETIPEEPAPPQFVHLATIFTEGDISLIKASLDQAGINYYFHGEQAHRLAPVPLGARLMVRRDFAAEAETILKEGGQL